MKTIFIGTTNPAKISAVQMVIQELWPEAAVVPLSVASGVPAQPLTDADTRQGAENRAQRAYEQGLSKVGEKVSADEAIGIGLEGGVTLVDQELWNTVWVSIYSSTHGLISVNGSRFKLPADIAARLQAGEELGAVISQMTGIDGINQKEGFIGYITGGLVTRSQEYGSLVRLGVGIITSRDPQL